MKNLVVFLYFVFLFKLAFAQSLPSLPSLESENVDENPSLVPEYVEVPSLNDDVSPPSLDIPTLAESNNDPFDITPPEMPSAGGFGGGWQDAPPAPPSPATFDAPAVAAPALEIDQFKQNSFEDNKKDDFAQELEVDDHYENVTIDNLLNEDLEIDVSKDQFPTTPALGGIQSNRDAEDEDNTVSFETKDVDKKEEQVLEALFKQEEPEVVEVEQPEEEVVIEDDGVDRLNDFEQNKMTRATHNPTTYSEDQLVEQLVRAAISGNRDAVLALLHSGRNPNARNKFGETPLMAAVYNGHNAITEILLAEGADANAYDNKGNTALHVAASKKNYFAVEKLVKYGAIVDPRNRSNDTPLLIATLNNSLDIVDLLIRSGADVNKSNDDGLTPLHVATFNNNIEVVKYLLYVGANANMINRSGLKPYDLAYGKNLEIARLLAGYTGKEKYISNDLPNLIQQQNNVNMQNMQPNNYSQQFNLFPQSYAEDQNADLRERQTAWWGAKQISNNNVSSVEDNSVYMSQPMPQQYSPPVAPQSIPQAEPVSMAQVAPASQSFDYNNLSKDRASKAQLSNVGSITNNYAPTQNPENIISQNLDFMGSSGKPKSEVYNGDMRHAGLPTPKSITEKPRQQANNYATQNPYNNFKANPVRQPTQQVASSKKSIVRYADMPMDKRMSWDKNLEKWLRASGRISEFNSQEKQVWEKQRTILQSVYQDQFRNSVEKTKRKIASQQSSSLNKYGVKVTPLTPARPSGLTRQQVGRALKTSYLSRNPSSI